MFVAESVAGDDGRDLLAGVWEAVTLEILVYRFVSHELFVQLRIYADREIRSPVHPTIEEGELSEDCLEECRFPHAVLSHDPYPVSALHDELRNEEERFFSADKRILEPQDPLG